MLLSFIIYYSIQMKEQERKKQKQLSRGEASTPVEQRTLS